ncbi:5'-nucleotidase C-terminal domain-containing protein [Melittangium boletus]|uniref:5'-nucleotidase C-terminal domain-containing protein n=1 Tax=Melittangium boletus TaxID=83453 RepID=UPI003DA3A6C3
MPRLLRTALLALALAPSAGCLQYNEQCQPLIADPDTVLGYLGSDVFLDRTHTRHDNHALGQLSADALLHAEDNNSPATPTELAVVNGGALRSEGLCVTRVSIPKGPLKNGLLHEVMLFENSVVTVDLTEKQVVDMFERSVSALFPANQSIISPPGTFLQVSDGVSLRVDCARPAGQRVQELTIGRRTVSLPPSSSASIRYRVAMSGYLAQGGDGYGAIFKDAASDVSRNPVTARGETGRATDVSLSEAYMKSRYGSEDRPLVAQGRIIFQNCARPTR